MSTKQQSSALAIALNSASGVPTEIQLLPNGHVRGRDGREFFNAQPHLLVEQFNRDSGDAVIDYEHATDILTGHPAPAAGWIKDMFVKNDGEIWATVEWTEKAATHIAAREYRYISPVFYHLDDERQTVTEILRASLTNVPNLEMAALNKPQKSSTQPEKPAMDNQKRVALCQSLGLADQASDQAILEAVAALQTEKKTALNKAANPDPQKYVPRDDYVALNSKFEEVQTALNKARELDAEAEIDKAIKDGKIAPASKEYHLKACNTDEGLEAFKKMVSGAPKISAATDADLENADTPQKSLNKQETQIAKQMGLDPTDEKVIAEFVKERTSDAN